MSFNRELVVKKTRKVHRCSWCESRIEAGESAIYFANHTCDYDFSAGYMHHECNHALKAAWDDNACGGTIELGGYARGSTQEHGEPEFNPDGTKTKP